jgi:hypothetical protein
MDGRVKPGHDEPGYAEILICVFGPLIDAPRATAQ